MIEFHNVTKVYDGKPVLRDLNLQLENGKTYILTGVSGIGKTTLLRLVLGLEEPDAGRIRREDAAAGADLTPGVVFQEDRLCEDFDAVTNVMLACPGMSREEAVTELKELLPEDALSKPVRDLSGGQRRRVAVCRAFAGDRCFYVLDEPFNGLDEETRKRTIAFIRREAEGRMLILAVHDLEGLEFGEEIRLKDRGQNTNRCS